MPCGTEFYVSFCTCLISIFIFFFVLIPLMTVWNVHILSKRKKNLKLAKAGSLATYALIFDLYCFFKTWCLCSSLWNCRHRCEMRSLEGNLPPRHKWVKHIDLFGRLRRAPPSSLYAVHLSALISQKDSAPGRLPCNNNATKWKKLSGLYFFSFSLTFFRLPSFLPSSWL